MRSFDRLGASPVHRRSFAPVRALLGLSPLLPAACPGGDAHGGVAT